MQNEIALFCVTYGYLWDEDGSYPTILDKHTVYIYIHNIYIYIYIFIYLLTSLGFVLYNAMIAMFTFRASKRQDIINLKNEMNTKLDTKARQV